MKKSLLVLIVSLITTISFSQSSDCFLRLQKAFDARGAFTVADDMHRNVIVSYFYQGGSSDCRAGKARVENGLIVSVFLQYDDNTYELLEDKFFNSKKQPPRIVNGISEMIFNSDNEKFKIVFIEQLRPKKKAYKSVVLPDDL
ncbi:MAG TPA: hypothetical protein EYG86_03340 [Crocinitomicaceae bacterium]|nr:hypothetical protein [Crocinitomicaceae bacterium]